MQPISQLSLLSLLATATVAMPFIATAYVVPAELRALSESAGCVYPGNFTVEQVTTWAPASSGNASADPYISFTYSDPATNIATFCAYNATSKSLTAGRGLAPRYACESDIVSFIWQKNLISIAETTCPEINRLISPSLPRPYFSSLHAANPHRKPRIIVSGSVQPPTLACSNTSADAAVGKSGGTICKGSGPVAGIFSSLEPDPLDMF